MLEYFVAWIAAYDEFFARESIDQAIHTVNSLWKNMNESEIRLPEARLDQIAGILVTPRAVDNLQAMGIIG